MSFERLVKNPRKAINDSDSWVRLQALSAISREPMPDDRIIFDEKLNDDDTIVAFLAHQGLSRLFPLPTITNEVWQTLFAETIELLEKRASSSLGSSQIRTAAVKALAFSTNLSISVIENVMKSLNSSFSYDSSLITPEPLLPLLERTNNFFLPESFGLLLSSMPIEQESTVNFLKNDIESKNPDRIIPALIALQINPSSEMTDQLVWISRNSEKRVADEAIRALLACGGKKVCLVITSLLKEARNPKRRIVVLPIAASTDREEIWPVLKGFALGKDINVAMTTLRAIDGYIPARKEDKLPLYSQISKRKEPNLMALSALLAWRAGSPNSIKLLKQLLDSDISAYRSAAVKILPEISTDKAISLILSHFDDEKDEDIINQMFLNLRYLFPKTKNTKLVELKILPWLRKFINSSENFIRNQTAVLCGCLGPCSEEIVLEALPKEPHPYVIASLLSALGKCGCNKLLLYTKYHDNFDARIRANMISAISNCGNEAISYLYDALDDTSPRVRAEAAYNLFNLGQLDAIKVLNDMLQIPEPISVLSACHSIYKIFKNPFQTLEPDHPLSLAIERKKLEFQRDNKFGPGLLNTPEAFELFNEMATMAGDFKKILWLFEEKHKRKSSSVIVTRLLASMYLANNNNVDALPLLEICINENQTNLADMLDAYRTVIKLGYSNKASIINDKLNKLYKMLFDGCVDICKNIKGATATSIHQHLKFLKEPSMNLYNTMIQLKVLENDTDTVMYLMTELILSKPFNTNLINKLANIMPENYSKLKRALLNYSKSIENKTFL